MQAVDVKINLFYDVGDISGLENMIKQVSVLGYNIIIDKPQVVYSAPGEIIIVSIHNINSKIIRDITSFKNSSDNKIIFVVNNDDAVFVSSLAKIGFTDIFVFPYESYKFISYLKELISTNSFRSIDPVKKEFFDFEALIGTSKKFARILEMARKVAEKPEVDVLILGETGTGKGLLAKAIHQYSSDNAPFVDIICSAIPESLMESELFGYEAGAFTNARARKLGLFELAENGTLFLDEVGELSPNLQAKLLRVIEKKVIRRLGGIIDIPVKTRIISATNRDLEKMVENNLFRKDLYHRLNVVSIDLPPLRERKEDIIPLAEFFIRQYNKQFNKNIYSISDDLKEFLNKYAWPGNIREFKNAFERAIVLSENVEELTLNHFRHFMEEPLDLPAFQKELPLLPDFIRIDVNYKENTLREIDKFYAEKVLAKVGNKSLTAKILGISRPKLDALLNEEM